MKTNTTLKYTASALMLASLFACGGGGGSSTPTPVAEVKTCANGGTNYPTCTPPYFAANLQTTVEKPPFAEGSEDLKAFNYLNDERAKLGLGKLNYSLALTNAATGHANYLKINAIQTHVQDSKLPGFTGVTSLDRAIAAGYKAGNTGEVISAAHTKTLAVQRLIDTVYHRSILFNQGIVDVGLGNYFYGDFTILVINTGVTSFSQNNASDFVMVYPRHNQSNVTLSMCGELPWPFPEIKIEDACKNPRAEGNEIVYDMNVGYPVSIAIETSKVLAVSKFEMFEDGSNTPLSVWQTTNSDPVFYVPKNEAFITAKSGLKPFTKYNVSFSGSYDGLPLTRNWSFTTGKGLTTLLQ